VKEAAVEAADDREKRAGQVSLLFRDLAGLLSDGGGTGKNQFFERLCARLIGEKYAYFVDDNNELYKYSDLYLQLFEQAKSSFEKCLWLIISKDS
jgi:hypothetical protein